MPGRIHVRVVRAHLVIGVVLHGIEAGHPRANEAEVIGAADLVDDVRAPMSRSGSSYASKIGRTAAFSSR